MNFWYGFLVWIFVWIFGMNFCMDFCMDMYEIHVWVRNFSNQILSRCRLGKTLTYKCVIWLFGLVVVLN